MHAVRQIIVIISGTRTVKNHTAHLLHVKDDVLSLVYW